MDKELLGLKTKFIGRKCFYYREIDSTQSEVFRRIDENRIENGTIVIADVQTNGKGTRGRIWHTDEGNNIAFSLYVNSKATINILNGITIEIAEILKKIFETVYNITLEIKYPNDLIMNKKKIGGILTECKVYREKVKYLVIGIGINTNKEYFSDDIKCIATSIKKEANIQIDNFKIISEFCNRFEKALYERIGDIA